MIIQITHPKVFHFLVFLKFQVKLQRFSMIQILHRLKVRNLHHNPLLDSLLEPKVRRVHFLNVFSCHPIQGNSLFDSCGRFLEGIICLQFEPSLFLANLL